MRHDRGWITPAQDEPIEQHHAILKPSCQQQDDEDEDNKARAAAHVVVASAEAVAAAAQEEENEKDNEDIHGDDQGAGWQNCQP